MTRNENPLLDDRQKCRTGSNNFCVNGATDFFYFFFHALFQANIIIGHAMEL